MDEFSSAEERVPPGPDRPAVPRRPATGGRVPVRKGVATIRGLETFDEGEVLCGYLDGLADRLPPEPARTCAWWHGWRNARLDRDSCAAGAA